MATPVDIGSFIDSDPGYWGGRPFIRGKRVTVQRIGIRYSEGLTPDEVATDLSLTLPEVYAGLAHYLANREAIDADVRAYDLETERIARAWRKAG